jgi:hypothetical protein
MIVLLQKINTHIFTAAYDYYIGKPSTCHVCRIPCTDRCAAGEVEQLVVQFRLPSTHVPAATEPPAPTLTALNTNITASTAVTSNLTYFCDTLLASIHKLLTNTGCNTEFHGYEAIPCPGEHSQAADRFG